MWRVPTAVSLQYLNYSTNYEVTMESKFTCLSTTVINVGILKLILMQLLSIILRGIAREAKKSTVVVRNLWQLKSFTFHFLSKLSSPFAIMMKNALMKSHDKAMSHTYLLPCYAIFPLYVTVTKTRKESNEECWKIKLWDFITANFIFSVMMSFLCLSFFLFIK